MAKKKAVKKLNLNDFAKLISEKEGLKIQLPIGQIKEIKKYVENPTD